MAVQYALAQVGEPYSQREPAELLGLLEGPPRPRGAEAGAGLTAYSVAPVGTKTRRVPVSDIQPGDLVFYFGLGARHVAIYIGNGKMVSASNLPTAWRSSTSSARGNGDRLSGVGRVLG